MRAEALASRSMTTLLVSVDAGTMSLERLSVAHTAGGTYSMWYTQHVAHTASDPSGKSGAALACNSAALQCRKAFWHQLHDLGSGLVTSLKLVLQLMLLFADSQLVASFVHKSKSCLIRCDSLAHAEGVGACR